MKPNLKAVLWILTLLTVIYVGQQYRIAQQARASARTQHTAIATAPAEIYKVTQIGSQVMRINETTGETHYWSDSGGGWVKIEDTSLVTTVSEPERRARKVVIQNWYNTIEPDLRKEISYEVWESAWLETPSWQIQDSFDKWKSKQTEEKQRAEQERRKPLIQSWYTKLTPQEQAATPYEKFEAALLAATDLSTRQEAIRSWYDLMDDAYKQKVSFERFEALEVQQPLANLQLALAKQQGLVPPSKSNPRYRFCPVGGETYEPNVKYCPKHAVETRIPSSN